MQDQLNQDGLRFVKRKAVGLAVTGPPTHSCWLCGARRTSASLQTRNLVGAARRVCAPKCDKGVK